MHCYVVTQTNTSIASTVCRFLDPGNGAWNIDAEKSDGNLPANFPSWSQTAGLWSWLPAFAAGFPSFSPHPATCSPSRGARLSNEQQLFCFTWKTQDPRSSCRAVAAGLDSLRLAALQKRSQDSSRIKRRGETIQWERGRFIRTSFKPFLKWLFEYPTAIKLPSPWLRS